MSKSEINFFQIFGVKEYGNLNFPVLSKFYIIHNSFVNRSLKVFGKLLQKHKRYNFSRENFSGSVIVEMVFKG